MLLLLLVGLIFAAGREATDSITATVDVRVPTALASTRAQLSLLKMRAAVRGYLAVGDLQNIDDYNKAKAVFQENLGQLKTFSADWSNAQDIQRLDELIGIFATWLPLPEKLFALHDNPLENQPALQIETGQIQPLGAALLDDSRRLIDLQNLRQPQQTLAANRALLADLVDFQTSLQAMNTNLRAYASTGDLGFKFGFADNLVTNSTLYGKLAAQQVQLDNEQRRLFAHITAVRSEFLALPNQLFAAVEGDHSHEDLYLFQHALEPQAEQMLQLLDGLTTGQQTLLQGDLNNGKRSLAGVQIQTLIGGLLALLLGILMTYFFRANIAGPLRRLTLVAQQLGADNLTVQARVEHGDEIGRLATTFNSMTGRLRKTIEELAGARDVAETASRAKSDFLACMSHELRTPLNGILGYVQILARDPALATSQHHALRVVRESGEHLLTLINDILDLSKIEARKLELTPTCFALAPFLQGIVDIFHIRAEQKAAIRFTFVTSPVLPTLIEADEKRLRQILINLLDNAFKFTHQGEISFSVYWLENGDQRDADLRETPALGETEPSETHPATRSRLRFEVIDSGSGISPDQIEKIFLPFEQSGDTQARASGVGLGLAITQELAHAMHAQLTVQSVPGQGSQFVFEVDLPVVNQQEQPPLLTLPREPNQRSAINGQTHRISTGSPNQQKPLTSQTHTQSVTVPTQELAILLDMAHKGELPRLRKRIAQIAAAQPQYQPFAQRMNQLIDHYDEEHILALLQDQQAASANNL